MVEKKKKGKLDQILDKLTEHDEKFKGIDARFDQQDKRFDQQDKRFDQQDKKFERIIDKLLEHDGEFGRIDDKITDKFDKVLTGQDKIMLELEKAREDRVWAKKKDDTQDNRLDLVEGRLAKVEALSN